MKLESSELKLLVQIINAASFTGASVEAISALKAKIVAMSEEN